MYKLDRVTKNATTQNSSRDSHKSPGKERDSIGSATAMHLLALALFLHISLPSLLFSSLFFFFYVGWWGGHNASSQLLHFLALKSL